MSTTMDMIANELRNHGLYVGGSIFGTTILGCIGHAGSHMNYEFFKVSRVRQSEPPSGITVFVNLYDDGVLIVRTNIYDEPQTTNGQYYTTRNAAEFNISDPKFTIEDVIFKVLEECQLLTWS